ncbi:MAG: alpha/beta hydrolase [Pseudomonadota bacterium]
MPQFLFVPGGKRSAQDFDSVRGLLRAQGRLSDAITLSDPEQNDLSQHIAEVCALVEEGDAKELHLCGHSYASFVITGAADRLRGRIARLVFIDTLIPESGRSLFDFFKQAGIDPTAFGVPAWPPFVEPLTFDEAAFAALPKTYLHCLRSQFLSLTAGIPADLQSRLASENWTYCALDADHYCMIDQPAAVVERITG